MKRSLIFIIALGAICTAPSMAEQLGPDYRESKKSANEIREVSNDYADCVVKKRPEMAREAILSNATNGVIAKKYRRLIIGSCLVKANDDEGGRMSFGGDHFRYAIAGALIRMDIQSHIPQRFEDIPPLSHYNKVNPNAEMMARTDRKGKKYQKKIATARSVRALSVYGECVVRSDPLNGFALATSEVGSRQEADAFAQLQPSFGPCLNREGEFRFTKAILRGLVNVNYYRLAMANASSEVSVIENAQPTQSEAQN